MRECLPAVLGIGSIFLPKTHSKSISAILITLEDLKGVSQDNCTSSNSPFLLICVITEFCEALCILGASHLSDEYVFF